MIARVTRHVTVLAALGAAVTSCEGKPKTEAARTVETGAAAGPAGAIVTAETTTVDLPLTLPSQLYVEHDAAVLARSSGMVQVILADIGSTVKAGQELARLESVDQDIALAQAKEKLARTIQNADRQRALTMAGVATRADSEQVEFEYREAELAVRKAQRDFDLTRIVAPFAGIVTARAARVQRMVGPGDSLFRVTALAPMLAAIRIPETAASGLRVGAEAQVLGAGGASARARVIRASPVLDAASGTRELVLEIGGGSRLRPGSAVTVQVGAERRQVITIPKSAIAREGYALVVEDNRTSLRAITLGRDVGNDRVEVVSGITPGEKVVSTAP
ncbi:MAG TPA: efflux RND transporter periplasmic adaptor subunit [Gemmatimonadales bacterium]|jgi:RND family efflux transporter MFP subunit